MTHRSDRSELDDVVTLIAEHGTDSMQQAFSTLLNIAMRTEREQVLGARPHERTPERRGHANGFKPKSLKTRVGTLTVQVPKTRGIDFYPSALERGVRSERALLCALAEMYVQGVSTRRVTAVLEELCGLEISSAQVSRATAELDDELEAWRTRPIGEVRYLILDARYEKVRHAGTVISTAVLVATGVLADGRRTILGVSVARSEAEVHWRAFLRSLLERGMHGVRLVVSDDHEGLRAAREAVLTGIPWQRCQFHLMRNAMAYVPKIGQRNEVAQELKTILNAADRDEADRRLRAMVERWKIEAPQLAAWLEASAPESMTVFTLSPYLRRRLRTTNAQERLNREIKRRTRVAGLFPNDASLLRLVTAILAEIDEEWTTGRVYLNHQAA
ncbi:MAG: IS256 family transposase [Phycisphaeraceae bacterium]|nr:IS256 family transposase [Phycisphaeraceae bacterium]MBX3356739.1 IS256 family transposase [Phycisphaeraceae bacterium]